MSTYYGEMSCRPDNQTLKMQPLVAEPKQGSPRKEKGHRDSKPPKAKGESGKVSVKDFQVQKSPESLEGHERRRCLQKSMPAIKTKHTSE